jgi:hypothetical protein
MNWHVLGLDKMDCWKVYVELAASFVHRVTEVLTEIVEVSASLSVEIAGNVFDPVTTPVVNVDV